MSSKDNASFRGAPMVCDQAGGEKDALDLAARMRSNPAVKLWMSVWSNLARKM
jgi:hypothetical protein